jgi:hypothetical protein
VADIFVVLVDTVNLFFNMVSNIGDNNVIIKNLFLNTLFTGFNSVAVFDFYIDIFAFIVFLFANNVLSLGLHLIARHIAFGFARAMRFRGASASTSARRRIRAARIRRAAIRRRATVSNYYIVRFIIMGASNKTSSVHIYNKLAI